jgi:putative transposase
MISPFTYRDKLRILKEGDDAGAVRDVCRKYGISRSTFYRWKAKRNSFQLDNVETLRALLEENQQLKHRMAELSLDYNTLRFALVNNGGKEC